MCACVTLCVCVCACVCVSLCPVLKSVGTHVFGHLDGSIHPFMTCQGGVLDGEYVRLLVKEVVVRVGVDT